MKALTWQGKRKVAVQEVPDPKIELPTDAIVKITSSAICGSDLHLYELLGPFIDAGDILGHEPMGVVVETGAEVTALRAGDRVVVPFNVSCGTCFMSGQGVGVGTEGFATHRQAAPEAYATFQARRDRMVKTLLPPGASTELPR